MFESHCLAFRFSSACACCFFDGRGFQAYRVHFQTNTGQVEGNGQVQCMQRFLTLKNVQMILTIVPDLISDTEKPPYYDSFSQTDIEP